MAAPGPIPVLRADAFEGDRLARPGTWAVAFVADWCPFCRRFQPIFETARGRGHFELAYGDVTDYESPLWERFALDVVPTVIAFRDGAAIVRKNGRFARGLKAADVEQLIVELRGAPGPGP